MIQINITADRGEGKTVCALAIRRALRKLGADVELLEHSGSPNIGPFGVERTLKKIKDKEPMLAGKKVGIDTFLPPGSQG